MYKERDKARKIVDLLMEYYVLHEYQNINVDVSFSNKETIIKIKGIVKLDILDLDKLKEILEHPRMVEYDDFYDELLVSSDDSEIHSLGYLIDESTVDLNENLLSINLIRKHL